MGLLNPAAKIWTVSLKIHIQCTMIENQVLKNVKTYTVTMLK